MRRFPFRRKAAFLVLAGILFSPGKGEPWGAIQGLAETHQYILTEAMKQAASDPAFVQKFPSAEELVKHDFVVVTFLGKSGPGPDMDGSSPYSWHYFNPLTGKGLAPKKVADFFNVMMHKRVRGEPQAREAAWAAHFLSDMFVPYHVAGMPEEEAWQFFMGGTPLGEKETGPKELYSMTSSPPAGWGEGGDFSSALELLFNEYPPGNEDGVDWFDPWYFNGWGGATAPGIATGSHGFWEYQVWERFRIRHIAQKNLPPQGYDPLWKNRKSEMGTVFWRAQAAAAAEYAAACAAGTRQNIHVVLANPDQGILNAVRAVYTLYRASMTSLRASWRQEDLTGGGYRVFCTVRNTNPREECAGVEARLLYRKDGRWLVRETVTLPRPVPPQGAGEFFWDFPAGDSFQCIAEVAGMFRQTPDLGYVNIPFTAGRDTPEREHGRTFAGKMNFSMANYPEGTRINQLSLSISPFDGNVRGTAGLRFIPEVSGGMKPMGLELFLEGSCDGTSLSGTCRGTQENFFWTGSGGAAGRWSANLSGEQVKGSIVLEKDGKTFSLRFYGNELVR
ncbi:hypothetical protein [Aminivibrio sp.]|uniref:hypothetical protein n=1 Tax=Aminivibrio sp. TaxID=1872489 RepID=UPI001A41D90B|nr:hypothetical protein [Aminivibrio sp.]MBL3539797.1 hypothetical protein [Aminivibrio sp.]MDK2958027.1 hypothetical protein [Synergistaceae bacterium]